MRDNVIFIYPLESGLFNMMISSSMYFFLENYIMLLLSPAEYNAIVQQYFLIY